MTEEPTDKELGELALLIYWDLEHGSEKDAIRKLRKLVAEARERKKAE